MRVHLKLMTLIMGLALLAGCGATDPVQPDQELTLPPGNGIAVVVVDSLDPLNGITLKSPDHKDAPDLEVGHVDKGVTMRVYVLPAGSYCVFSFFFGIHQFKEKDPDHDVCFDVIAGIVAYSGNIGPRSNGSSKSATMMQHYDWKVFESAFKVGYPKLSQYPIVTP